MELKARENPLTIRQKTKELPFSNPVLEAQYQKALALLRKKKINLKKL